MNLLKILFLMVLQSCAYVHHTQVGEIKSHPDFEQIPFEVLVSETGFNLQEAGAIGRAVIADKNAGKNLKAITDIIGLFQMGPRTGQPVYSGDTYADIVYLGLYEKCPTGQITGLQATREMNRYPVVSGEIVKITGLCLKKKTKPVRKKI
jgi:hypothetical protein